MAFCLVGFLGQCVGFPARLEAASFCWKCQAEAGCISLAAAWVFSSLRWTRRGCLLRDALTAKENHGRGAQTRKRTLPFPGARVAVSYLPVEATCPCRAGTAPGHRCHGRHGAASRARSVRSVWAGKGHMNLINYVVRFCHKQIFCHCSASLVKFTVRGARSDVYN